MARLRFTVSTEGEIAIVAATAKTVLQVQAPTNQRVAIRGLEVSFDGTSGSAEPGSVELVTQTQVLQGSPSTATPVKDDPGVSCGVQTSCKKWASGTTEPTDAGVGAVMDDFHMHPQTGLEKRFWLDEEKIIKEGTWVGVRVIQPANVNCRARLILEE